MSLEEDRVAVPPGDGWTQAVGPLEILRTLLYELYFVDDLNGFSGLDDRGKLRLKALYPIRRIEKFRMALDWAMVCTDFDFCSLLPNLPYDNEQIVSYLTGLHRSIEDLALAEGWPAVDQLAHPNSPAADE